MGETAKVHARGLFLAFLLATALFRLPDVWRPVDGSTWNSWREVDVAAIARNFYREGMNILYPRIDWRGDGPGFVESELPLYPWTVAQAYRWFGYREELARVLAFGLALAASAFFFLLAREVLRPAGLALALAFWVVNPLGVRMATSVQPEPLMALALLAAIYFFRRWLAAGTARSYGLALAFTILAVLAKLPALYVGLLLAALFLDRFGLRGLLRLDVWAFAGTTALASAAWYLHARGLFLAYGNSLGASNEAYRLITVEGVLGNARWTIPGNLRNEVSGVWTAPGVLLGAIGLYGARRQASGRFVAFWLGALAVFYAVAGRTTGQPWALYYHIASVPAAALAVGLGAEAVAELLSRCAVGRAATRWILLATLAAAAAAGVLGLGVRGDLACTLAAAAALGGGAWFLLRALAPPAGPAPGSARRCLAGLLGCLLVGGTLAAEGRRTWKEMHPRPFEEQYACAREFAGRVEPGSLVVASGGTPTIEGAQALDAPYFFFWMDRKGFSLAHHSLEDVEAFRARGAKYLVVEREFADRMPGFEERVRGRYSLVAECRGNLLLRLAGR